MLVLALPEPGAVAAVHSLAWPLYLAPKSSENLRVGVRGFTPNLMGWVRAAESVPSSRDCERQGFSQKEAAKVT